eukprot:GHVU01210958.1.p1 GENE.GHVU01210958.1~~GHVU01210958.1.p1  ORF type:complete len:412 (+),score=24.43 GHVU01210958.1:968-2203(+)
MGRHPSFRFFELWKELRKFFRITVDLRKVNSMLHEPTFAFPDLEEELEYIGGAQFFAVLDFVDGYTQTPLAEESREIFSLVTGQGVFTPFRVPQGANCSVAYFQSTMERTFRSLHRKGLLIYIDDLLVYANSLKELHHRIEQVMEICDEHNLKLSAAKSTFVATEVKWCGRLISAAGVRHSPDRIEALVNLPIPQNGAQLYQFICAAGWMRNHVPRFAQLVQPLQEVVHTVKKLVGSTKKLHCRKIPLTPEVGWSEGTVAAFNSLKQALISHVRLAHPDDENEVIICTDASDKYWGGVITQVDANEWRSPLMAESHQGIEPDDGTARQAKEAPCLRKISQLNHEALAFISGEFKGPQLNWSATEKEAFSTKTTLLRYLHLCYRNKGVILLTDHRNLQFILGSDFGVPSRRM